MDIVQIVWNSGNELNHFIWSDNFLSNADACVQTAMDESHEFKSRSKSEKPLPLYTEDVCFNATQYTKSIKII